MKKTKRTRSFFRWGAKPKEDSRHGPSPEAGSKLTAKAAKERSPHRTLQETPPELNVTAQVLIEGDIRGTPSVLSTQALETPPDTKTMKEFKPNTEFAASQAATPKGTHLLDCVYL
jgi:hypothetical protein